MTVTARRFASRPHGGGPARTSQPTRVAGDGLLHPVAVAAVVLLVLNDHLFKPILPGLLTGKLSDVAGLLLAPVLAVAAIELTLAARRRRASPNQRWLFVICALTATIFIAVKTTGAGALALGVVLGIGQWAGGMVLAPLLGPPPQPAIASVAVDPTDLVALGSVAAALALCLRRRALLSAAGWR